MIPVISEHIEITPGVCGGKPRIAGRRIRVQDIVILHDRRALSPEEIVSEYPDITLADVHAALTYYYDHREEIRELMQQEGEFAAALEARTGSILKRKPRSDNAEHDSVSSG